MRQLFLVYVRENITISTSTAVNIKSYTVQGILLVLLLATR